VSRLCTGVLSEVQATIADLLPGVAPRPIERLLDVGCWDGSATARYASALGCESLGVEVFEEQAAGARRAGVEVEVLDLETERFPWPDASVDVVVANQVLEHLKNVWLPMAEAFRVLRPGGALVVSTPNLASLHNRALLALGRQPTSIRTAGPHVRGFTTRELRDFVELAGPVRVESVTGVGFYPLPAHYGRPLARVWTGACHTPVVVARRLPGEVEPSWPRELVGDQTYYPETAQR
jgi:SAM-dependent methyltransferase